MIKIIKRLVFLLVAAALFVVGGFLLFITLTDYKPEASLSLAIDNPNDNKIKPGEAFTVTTFNIGYAGLDQNSDFFMDGGTMSRASSKEQTTVNLQAITAFMKEKQSDIFMLQEVDVKSSRSYRMNQVEYLTSELASYSHAFALNYKVPWVPVPLFDPMGAVQSGLLTLSTLHSTDNKRLDLPGKESWPRQQLDLDRALLVSRFPVDNGKELVLINLHLSAFDKGGSIRKQQLSFLSSYIQQEYEQGNYLIVGGDWNHSLPGTDPLAFTSTQDSPEWLQSFPDQFEPASFQWALDKEIATVRTMDIPYTDGINFRAIIDGFFLSPNIEVIKVQGTELKYEHSDHNPVTATLVLR